MTEHPLTDELLQQIGCSNPRARVFDAQAMRTAADWQLEQAVEWLKNCNMDHSLSYDGEYRSDRYLVVNAFREAMRPQEEN